MSATATANVAPPASHPMTVKAVDTPPMGTVCWAMSGLQGSSNASAVLSGCTSRQLKRGLHAVSSTVHSTAHCAAANMFFVISGSIRCRKAAFAARTPRNRNTLPQPMHQSGPLACLLSCRQLSARLHMSLEAAPGTRCAKRKTQSSPGPAKRDPDTRQMSEHLAVILKPQLTPLAVSAPTGAPAV